MTKIWQKDTGVELDQLIEDYTVGNDYNLDLELIAYDVKASIAHVKMLEKIEVLDIQERDVLISGLNEIVDISEKGEFKILKSQEDGHAAIEEYLTQKYGDVGKKIHTGRSRNDQILVTTRLFTIDKIAEIVTEIEKLIVTFDTKISEIGEQNMPGYTHMQRAMPSTVGMWLGSFKNALQDDLIFIQAAKKINNQNPLGSVAGFGEDVFGLDREFTSELLGFDKVQSNPMYCAYSRGKFENIVLQSLSQVMLDLGKFASDLMLFSTKEFDYFNLNDEFKTGSSVMPQKKNLDIMELIRGNSNLFQGYEFQIKEVFKNLMSGYNRDFQLTKEPYLKGINLALNTVKVSNLVVNNMTINKEKLENACSSELYATQEAYKLVKSGMSFRDAYKIIGEKYM